MLKKSRNVGIWILILALIITVTPLPISAEVSESTKVEYVTADFGVLKMFSTDLANTVNFTFTHEYFGDGHTWRLKDTKTVEGGTADVNYEFSAANKNLVVTLSNMNFTPNATEFKLSHTNIDTTLPGNAAALFNGELKFNFEIYDVEVNDITVWDDNQPSEQDIKNAVVIKKNGQTVNDSTIEKEVDLNELAGTDTRQVTVRMKTAWDSIENRSNFIDQDTIIRNSPFESHKTVTVNVNVKKKVEIKDNEGDQLADYAGRVIVKALEGNKLVAPYLANLGKEGANTLIIDVKDGLQLGDALSNYLKLPDFDLNNLVAEKESNRFISYTFSGYHSVDTDFPRLPNTPVAKGTTVVYEARYQQVVEPILLTRGKNGTDEIVDLSEPDVRDDYALITFKVEDGLEATWQFKGEELKIGDEATYPKEIKFWVRKDKNIKGEALNKWAVATKAGSDVEFDKWDVELPDDLLLDKDMTFVAKVKVKAKPNQPNQGGQGNGQKGMGNSYFLPNVQDFSKLLPYYKNVLADSKKDNVPDTAASIHN